MISKVSVRSMDCGIQIHINSIQAARVMGRRRRCHSLKIDVALVQSYVPPDIRSSALSFVN